MLIHLKGLFQEGFVRSRKDLESQIRRALEASVEARMRSIREKISITSTFCSTIEVQIRFGHLDRAGELMSKLHCILHSLEVHVSDPAHVSGQQAMQFRKQLAQVKRRLAGLEAEIHLR